MGPTLTCTNFRQFRIVLKSCANSYAVFSMYDANFTLGTDSNTISFGSGPAVGENLVLTIRGQSNGENELPGAAVRYDYTSKNNEVWIELDAPVYGVNLAITYRIELERKHPLIGVANQLFSYSTYLIDASRTRM